MNLIAAGYESNYFAVHRHNTVWVGVGGTRGRVAVTGSG